MVNVMVKNPTFTILELASFRETLADCRDMPRATPQGQATAQESRAMVEFRIMGKPVFTSQSSWHLLYKKAGKWLELHHKSHTYEPTACKEVWGKFRAGKSLLTGPFT
jgi:hypothetical protein